MGEKANSSIPKHGWTQICTDKNMNPLLKAVKSELTENGRNYTSILEVMSIIK
jgi:hypothetical protein